MIIPQGFPSIPTDFEYETEVHESLDGEHTIFFNVFRKKGVTPKRALMIIHGQGEHGGRYQHVPHYLGEDYDLIVAPDLRGHGRSEGIRGHVDRFDEYVDDALLAWNWLQKQVPVNCKMDWLGHSMGGLVSLRAFLYRQDLNADHLIISSPLIGLKVPVPMVKVVAAKVVSKFFGALQMQTGLDATKVSRDPNVVDAYLKDRLNHSIATPKFFFSMKEAMEGLVSSDLRIHEKTRVLFQLAGEDEIVDTGAAKDFFERLHHEDKKVIVYPGLYHEIYNELVKENVFDDLKNWIHQA
jgi:alpha-beta hydrolase superfamily lysophospholipase